MSKPTFRSSQELSPLLTNFLSRAFLSSQSQDLRQVRVESLRLLTGGASRQTWSFDAVLEQADGRVMTFPFILRSDPQEGPQAVMDRSLEFRVIKAAHAAGVLVPK